MLPGVRMGAARRQVVSHRSVHFCYSSAFTSTCLLSCVASIPFCCRFASVLLLSSRILEDYSTQRLLHLQSFHFLVCPACLSSMFLSIASLNKYTLRSSLHRFSPHQQNSFLFVTSDLSAPTFFPVLCHIPPLHTTRFPSLCQITFVRTYVLPRSVSHHSSPHRHASFLFVTLRLFAPASFPVLFHITLIRTYTLPRSQSLTPLRI